MPAPPMLDTVLWTVLPLLQLAWVIALSVWIVLERRSPAATIAWILVLAFLPVFGILLYLFLGPRRLARKRDRHQESRAQVVRDVAPSLPCEDLPATADDPGGRVLLQLAGLAERSGAQAPTRASAVTLFFEGEELYQALLDAFRQAEHHIHLEYYIFETDSTGRRIRDGLIERLEAGVEVRLLVDALGSYDLDGDFLEPFLKAGGKVAYFNAVFGGRKLRPRLINFRTHRKIVVCDGKTGFVGGVNIADVHTSAESGDEAWRDTHLRIEGAAVRGLQLLFLEDWHFATGTAPLEDAYCPALPPTGRHIVQILGSGPDTDEHSIHKMYFAAIASARSRVLVTTPYFVPDRAILTALSTASLRGVEVQILVPAPRHNDLGVVAAAARTYFPELLKVGVRVFEYQPTMLHAKTLVVDDEFAMVGTANMDNRSFRLNFEVAAAVYGESAALELAGQFAQDLRRAREVTEARLEATSLPRRTYESAARLLSPLL